MRKITVRQSNFWWQSGGAQWAGQYRAVPCSRCATPRAARLCLRPSRCSSSQASKDELPALPSQCITAIRSTICTAQCHLGEECFFAGPCGCVRSFAADGAVWLGRVNHSAIEQIGLGCGAPRSSWGSYGHAFQVLSRPCISLTPSELTARRRDGADARAAVVRQCGGPAGGALGGCRRRRARQRSCVHAAGCAAPRHASAPISVVLEYRFRMNKPYNSCYMLQDAPPQGMRLPPSILFWSLGLGLRSLDLLLHAADACSHQHIAMSPGA